MVEANNSNICEEHFGVAYVKESSVSRLVNVISLRFDRTKRDHYGNKGGTADTTVIRPSFVDVVTVFL